MSWLLRCQASAVCRSHVLSVKTSLDLVRPFKIWPWRESVFSVQQRWIAVLHVGTGVAYIVALHTRLFYMVVPLHD